MKLVASLAITELLKDRIGLICNVAIIAGVLVPLLLLFGVKNGVYNAMIGRLLSNPAMLQIDTAGNHAFTRADLEELRSWPETGFATLKTRSLFDYVNVRSIAARKTQEAILQPSGAGDPTLPENVALSIDHIAISATLAQNLSLAPGDAALLVTQAEGRPRQLALPVTVVSVAAAEKLAGRSVLADIAILDLVEAFYDGYALPEFGVADGRDLAERVATFEGLRAYAKTLEDLQPLQSRMETRFGLRTEARSREVASVLGLGRNLNLALALVSTVAAIGLAATLVFGFWGEVVRKRRLVATLALLGLPAKHVAAFPMIQAAMVAILGLAVSFLLLGAFALVAQKTFSSDLLDHGSIIALSFGEALTIILVVFAFVLAAALMAVFRAMRIDPAIVLREQT